MQGVFVKVPECESPLCVSYPSFFLPSLCSPLVWKSSLRPMLMIRSPSSVNSIKNQSRIVHPSPSRHIRHHQTPRAQAQTSKARRKVMQPATRPGAGRREQRWRERVQRQRPARERNVRRMNSRMRGTGRNESLFLLYSPNLLVRRGTGKDHDCRGVVA